MAFRAKSAKEMAEDSDFPTLPDDEYLGTVTSYEFQPQKPVPWNPGELRDQYLFKIRLESFADGSPLEDTNGDALKSEFVLNAFIDHNRLGMIPVPSKARKFFAALMRQPIGDAIEIENFPDELVGKQLLVATMNKPGKEGGEFTRPQDFRAVKIERKSRKGASLTAPAEEAPDATSEEDDDIQF
jgi:hypothetical protein